jgi:hypothetical protein
MMSGECDCCGDDTMNCVCKILKEAWQYSVDAVQAEYGSEYPIEVSEGKLYDTAGKEIEVPVCEKCGSFKNMLIGRNAFQWVCVC